MVALLEATSLLARSSRCSGTGASRQKVDARQVAPLSGQARCEFLRRCRFGGFGFRADCPASVMATVGGTPFQGDVVLQGSAEPATLVPRRQPVFNIPRSILLVVGVLVTIHLARQFIPERLEEALFGRLAFVPGRLTFAFAPNRVVEATVALAGQGVEGYRQAQAGRYFLGDGSAQPWTTVTYALLHADWAHVGLNAVWLLAFGTPVSRRFGSVRFLAFLIATAFAGAVVHYLAHPLDLAPVIGASASVSGCMGATPRFMFQPHVPVASIIGAAEDGRRQAFLQPAQRLREVVADRRALAFLVAWFATNLVFGLGSITWGAGSGPIAWEAHIGGFMIGLLLFHLFDPVRDTSGTPLAELAPLAPEEPSAGF